MAPTLVPDDLWQIIEPLLPLDRPEPHGGRPRVPNRKCLTGIPFVLRTGLPWEDFPAELGRGAGTTRWRRQRDWPHAGEWRRLQDELPNRLCDADAIDWSRASVDASLAPANGGAVRPSRIRRTVANRARSAI